jgi:hypothetical protein
MGKHGNKKRNKFPPLPGSFEAKKHGCTCEELGVDDQGKVHFSILVGCPLHGLHDVLFPKADESMEETSKVMEKWEKMVEYYMKELRYG